MHIAKVTSTKNRACAYKSEEYALGHSPVFIVSLALNSSGIGFSALDVNSSSASFETNTARVSLRGGFSSGWVFINDTQIHTTFLNPDFLGNERMDFAKKISRQNVGAYIRAEADLAPGPRGQVCWSRGNFDMQIVSKAWAFQLVRG